MFNRLFTRLLTGYPQPATLKNALLTLAERCESLESRCHRLEIANQQSEEALSTTNAALGKLRGQVHGHRAHSPPPRDSAAVIPFGDKAALRAHAGIRPGVPYNHQDEKSE